MRVITVAVIWALLVELLVGLSFLVGYHWLGGLQMGLLLAGAMLLLLALPWLGELRARYDSATGSVRARIGWWGRVTLTGKPEPLLEVRICGIPWRRKLGARKIEDERPRRVERPTPASACDVDVASDERPAKTSATRFRVDHENIDDITRAVTAALSAGNDLLWDAREVYFRIDAPTENTAYDDVIARIVGYRGVGPVDVKVRRGDGKRRIRARYSIGLFRADAISLCMAAQGRVWALWTRSEGRRADKATSGSFRAENGVYAPFSDEQLIRDLTETTERAGDDDGV